MSDGDYSVTRDPNGEEDTGVPIVMEGFVTRKVTAVETPVTPLQDDTTGKVPSLAKFDLPPVGMQQGSHPYIWKPVRALVSYFEKCNVPEENSDPLNSIAIDTGDVAVDKITDIDIHEADLTLSIEDVRACIRKVLSKPACYQLGADSDTEVKTIPGSLEEPEIEVIALSQSEFVIGSLTSDVVLAEGLVNVYTAEPVEVPEPLAPAPCELNLEIEILAEGSAQLERTVKGDPEPAGNIDVLEVAEIDFGSQNLIYAHNRYMEHGLVAVNLREKLNVVEEILTELPGLREAIKIQDAMDCSITYMQTPTERLQLIAEILREELDEQHETIASIELLEGREEVEIIEQLEVPEIDIAVQSLIYAESLNMEHQRAIPVEVQEATVIELQADVPEQFETAEQVQYYATKEFEDTEFQGHKLVETLIPVTEEIGVDELQVVPTEFEVVKMLVPLTEEFEVSKLKVAGIDLEQFAAALSEQTEVAVNEPFEVTELHDESEVDVAEQLEVTVEEEPEVAVTVQLEAVFAELEQLEVAVAEKFETDFTEQEQLEVAVTEKFETDFAEQEQLEVAVAEKFEADFTKQEQLEVAVAEKFEADFTKQEQLEVAVAEKFEADFTKQEQLEVAVTEQFEADFTDQEQLEVAVAEKFEADFTKEEQLEVAVAEKFETDFAEQEQLELSVAEKFEADFTEQEHLEVAIAQKFEDDFADQEQLEVAVAGKFEAVFAEQEQLEVAVAEKFEADFADQEQLEAAVAEKFEADFAEQAQLEVAVADKLEASAGQDDPPEEAILSEYIPIDEELELALVQKMDSIHQLVSSLLETITAVKECVLSEEYEHTEEHELSDSFDSIEHAAIAKKSSAIIGFVDNPLFEKFDHLEESELLELSGFTDHTQDSKSVEQVYAVKPSIARTPSELQLEITKQAADVDQPELVTQSLSQSLSHDTLKLETVSNRHGAQELLSFPGQFVSTDEAPEPCALRTQDFDLYVYGPVTSKARELAMMCFKMEVLQESLSLPQSTCSLPIKFPTGKEYFVETKEELNKMLENAGTGLVCCSCFSFTAFRNFPGTYLYPHWSSELVQAFPDVLFIRVDADAHILDYELEWHTYGETHRFIYPTMLFFKCGLVFKAIVDACNEYYFGFCEDDRKWCTKLIQLYRDECKKTVSQVDGVSFVQCRQLDIIRDDHVPSGLNPTAQQQLIKIKNSIQLLKTGEVPEEPVNYAAEFEPSVYFMEDETELSNHVAAAGSKFLVCYYSTDQPKESPEFLTTLKQLAAANNDVHFLYTYRSLPDFPFDQLYVYRNEKLVLHQELGVFGIYPLQDPLLYKDMLQDIIHKLKGEDEKEISISDFEALQWFEY